MDKQQIAHRLKEEISMIDLNIKRLYCIQQQMIDVHQARDLDFTINELIKHKQSLENIIENIVEDARNYPPPFKFGL